MIDLKSALESVQYNTGALSGGNQLSPKPALQQTEQTGQNQGILASILKKIAPTMASGGSVPPVS